MLVAALQKEAEHLHLAIMADPGTQRVSIWLVLMHTVQSEQAACLGPMTAASASETSPSPLQPINKAECTPCILDDLGGIE